MDLHEVCCFGRGTGTEVHPHAIAIDLVLECGCCSRVLINKRGERHVKIVCLK